MVFEESTNNRVRPTLPANAGAKWAEATSFIRDVRSAYAMDPSPNNYEKFLIVLKEFKQAHLPLAECFKLIAGLFKHNPHLIPSFNVFAPAGWRLEYREGRAYIHNNTEVQEVPENIVETYNHIFERAEGGLGGEGGFSSGAQVQVVPNNNDENHSA